MTPFILMRNASLSQSPVREMTGDCKILEALCHIWLRSLCFSECIMCIVKRVPPLPLINIVCSSKGRGDYVCSCVFAALFIWFIGTVNAIL